MHYTDEKSLAEFVAKYARPYAPETDTYDRPAFAADIKEGKNDPIYNAHSYHTKVPPRAIIPYILHYTEPGDLILDPFCGSGMTGVAAMMCSDPPHDLLEKFPDLKGRVGPRRAILNDLSPAACHIASNYCTPVDVNELKMEFQRIKAAVKEEFDGLYGTEHYEPAIGIYAPAQLEVAIRLKTLPPDVTVPEATGLLTDASQQTWEMVDRTQVEKRLGYSIQKLSFQHRTDLPKEFDASTLDRWLVIPATIQYTIWSDVYRCDGMVTVEEPTGKMSTRGKNAGKPMMRKRRVSRGCGKEIILWNEVVDQETGEINDEITCPNPTCNQKWVKTSIRRCGLVPVVTNSSFIGLRRTKRGTVVSTVRTERNLSALERLRVKEIDKTDLPEWCPNFAFDRKGPPYRRNALSARNIVDVRDFYTKRNLRALVKLWSLASEISDSAISSRVKFAITAICMTMTRMYKYRADRKGSILMGSLYIPSITQEMNVGNAFAAKAAEVISAAEAQSTLAGDCFVCCGPASEIHLEESSVDYIFADPPFGSNIYYSEASFIWESWLGKFTNRQQEAVVHRKNDGGTKRIPDYTASMCAAFRRMYYALKPGRWATIEFNNSDGQVFEAIKSAVREAGFQIENMLFLDKEQKTFKQIKGVKGEEDVVGHDVIFNLRKAHTVERPAQKSGLSADIVRMLVEAVTDHLRTLPERMKQEPKTYTEDHRTTPFLNTMLMNTLIPRGVDVSQLNLPFIEQVCSRYFRKFDGRWYLRSEAVGTGNGRALFQDIDVIDEASAIAWLRQQISQRPMVIGEIKPHWMRAIGLLPNEVSRLLDLEELLVENFYRDLDTNRWREPTEEERGLINDNRVLRVVHETERFLARTLRREPGDAELCEWIDILFRACKSVEEKDTEALPALRGFTANEGYKLICGIFPSVLRDKVPGATYTRAGKQADVASKRLHKNHPTAKAPTKEKAGNQAQPSLFDELERP